MKHLTSLWCNCKSDVVNLSEPLISVFSSIVETLFPGNSRKLGDDACNSVGDIERKGLGVVSPSHMRVNSPHCGISITRPTGGGGYK